MNAKDLRDNIAKQCGFNDHDCKTCGEHFSVCICNDQQGETDTFSEPAKIQFFADTGELPLEYLREYDGAAEHFARQGKLPDAMGSHGAIDYINADWYAFEQRVREFKYGHAMEATHNKAKLDWPTVKEQEAYWRDREEHLAEIESNAQFYDETLRDAGRNEDGSGESFAERNQ